MTKREINRFFFDELVEKLFFGIALTDNHMSIASEIIYKYFYNNNAGHLIKDIVLKTEYKKEKDGTETKIRSWLETRDGTKLNQVGMYNLKYRISY